MSIYCGSELQVYEFFLVNNCSLLWGKWFSLWFCFFCRRRRRFCCSTIYFIFHKLSQISKQCVCCTMLGRGKKTVWPEMCCWIMTRPLSLLWTDACLLKEYYGKLHYNQLKITVSHVVFILFLFFLKVPHSIYFQIFFFYFSFIHSFNSYPKKKHISVYTLCLQPPAKTNKQKEIGVLGSCPFKKNRAFSKNATNTWEGQVRYEHPLWPHKELMTRMSWFLGTLWTVELTKEARTVHTLETLGGVIARKLIMFHRWTVNLILCVHAAARAAEMPGLFESCSAARW